MRAWRDQPIIRARRADSGLSALSDPELDSRNSCSEEPEKFFGALRVGTNGHDSDDGVILDGDGVELTIRN